MTQKRAIIMGATSGIGLEVAKLLVAKGWRIGAAGRREEALQELKATAPSQIETARIDITAADAPKRLAQLIDNVGGMDLYFHSSGMGKQNKALKADIELQTVRTNCEGFVRMVDAAFHYFEQRGQGHIAVISSIAGTKGLGSAPAYSATKAMNNTYVEALAQLTRIRNLNIRFTDIRPGFVDTGLLDDSHHYPMLMRADKVAAYIVAAVERKKRVAVIDWRYRLLVFFWRLIPRCIWERLKIVTADKEESEPNKQEANKTKKQAIMNEPTTHGYHQPRHTPGHITSLAPQEVFVFGSNLQGMHGGGAARIANQYFGAQMGVGVGMTGQCYAIPTMHGGVEAIRPYVDDFVAYAKAHTDKVFLVTRIGCGIAGFSDEEMAPLFKEAVGVENIVLPKNFEEVIEG